MDYAVSNETVLTIIEYIDHIKVVSVLYEIPGCKALVQKVITQEWLIFQMHLWMYVPFPWGCELYKQISMKQM